MKVQRACGRFVDAGMLRWSLTYSGPAVVFEDGTETIYTARFHLIVPNVRLIYAFDMQVGGKLFSVSLAGVEFEEKSAPDALLN